MLAQPSSHLLLLSPSAGCLWCSTAGSRPHACASSSSPIPPCRKFIPGFSRTSIKQESLEIYKDVCRLLAEGDKTELRHLVTPAVFSDMKRQLKQREDGGWARVQWDLVRVRPCCWAAAGGGGQ